MRIDVSADGADRDRDYRLRVNGDTVLNGLVRAVTTYFLKRWAATALASWGAPDAQLPIPGGIWVIFPEGKHLGTILTLSPTSILAFGDANGRTPPSRSVRPFIEFR